MKNKNNDLAAFCGLYCGACSFKVAFDEKCSAHVKAMPSAFDEYKDQELQFCPGCRLDNQCGECDIRDCAKEKNIEHCGDCNEFPCERIKAFAEDEFPHHSHVISNLKGLKTLGTEEWLSMQDKKWRCKCGGKTSWYLDVCCACAIENNQLND